MVTPDAAYVRRRSALDWDEQGFPVGDPDPLEDEVADAVEYVQGVTWRKLDDTMPLELERRAARAAWLRTEQQVILRGADMVADVNDEVTQSESAGGASVTKKDPGRRGEQQQINPNGDLARLLWQLMTPEAFAWWRAFLSGQAPPLPASVAMGGFMVLETAWDLVHASPYQDVIDTDVYRSVYFGRPDPGDVPYVPDPLGEVW